MLFWDEEGGSEVWSFFTSFSVLEENPQFANSAKGVHSIVEDHLPWIVTEYALVLRVLKIFIAVLVEINVTGFFMLLDWIGFGWVIDSSFWFLKIFLGLWVSALFLFDCGRTIIFHYCKRVAFIK
jgi:hypothetical protein